MPPSKMTRSSSWLTQDMTPEEAQALISHAVVFVDEENKISRVTNYEKHGLLKDMA